MEAKKVVRSKEYFPESLYGKASPRVSTKRTNLPRGGGRDQVGKPYQVRGKWYYPKEDPKYSKSGGASWYGDAFHGRLTANGEIYDMTNLTAAHPTMPLPSYARVTNKKNGASVIVRVNDRGPYASGRIIDLSRKAAEMLDYTHDGIATVKVDYIGRAPLHGKDDQYLLASYKPGNVAPDPSDGMPTGVMIAMNGSTPNSTGPAQAFPGELADATPESVATESVATTEADEPLALPDVAPILPTSPDGTRMALATLGYAAKNDKVNTALAAMDRFMRDGDTSGPTTEFVLVGTFAEEAQAVAMKTALQDFGRVEIETNTRDGQVWNSVNLRPDGRYAVDDMLKAAWQAGAPDAMTVHD